MSTVSLCSRSVSAWHRSLETSRQLSKSSRSAEAQLLDSVLSSQPLPGSSATESRPLPGHPQTTYISGRPMHSFSSHPSLSQQSSHDLLTGSQLVQLRGIPRTGPHMVIPMGSGAVLANAPAGRTLPTFTDVPESLDDIVQALEGGELSLLPETSTTGNSSPGCQIQGPNITILAVPDLDQHVLHPPKFGSREAHVACSASL